MIENILLSSCSSPFLDNDKVYPPLGLLYLHQSIKQKNNCQVEIVEGLPDNLSKYDLIGISIMTPQREEAIKELNRIKKEFPDKKVIAGGPHITNYFQEARNYGFDQLVLNDGIRSINSIIQGNNLKYLNDFISPKEYKQTIVKPNRLDNKEFLKQFSYKLNGLESTTLLTSQGCPMKCAFCEEAGLSLRRIPLEIFQEEIKDIKELGYNGVYIFDDIFALSKNHLIPRAEELKKNNLIYRCNIQARLFNEEIADILKDTGCVEIAFGAESGSQRILNNVNKQTTIEQNKRAVQLIKERDIKLKLFMMLGLPGENKGSLQKTKRFIIDTMPEGLQLAIYYPYKGTIIRESLDLKEDKFDLSIQKNGLGAYGQKNNFSESTIQTKNLSSEDLINARNEILGAYNFYKDNPLDKIAKIVKFKN